MYHDRLIQVMQEVITKFEQRFKKPAVPAIKSGDTVRVYQKVREAGKERVQVFEGIVIKTMRMASLTASISVRRVASGVGVEKTYQLHSPQITQVQVVRRGKVRRNFLTYMRARSGKSARITEREFDLTKANVKSEPKAHKEPGVQDDSADVKAEASEQKAESTIDTGSKPGKTSDKPKAEAPAEPVVDKSAEKKAKAEAFRQAQAAKNQK